MLVQDDKECIYVYRLTWRGRQQTGFMLLSAADDYLKGNIKRHEFTRADKEAGRTRLEETLNAQAGQVFLFYPPAANLDTLLAEVAAGKPEYDFEADEVRNQFWVVSDSKTIQRIVEGFAKVEATYIADGHHRCAAAVNVCKNRRFANPNYQRNRIVQPFSDRCLPIRSAQDSALQSGRGRLERDVAERVYPASEIAFHGRTGDWRQTGGIGAGARDRNVSGRQMVPHYAVV